MTAITQAIANIKRDMAIKAKQFKVELQKDARLLRLLTRKISIKPEFYLSDKPLKHTSCPVWILRRFAGKAVFDRAQMLQQAKKDKRTLIQNNNVSGPYDMAIKNLMRRGYIMAVERGKYIVIKSLPKRCK